MQGRDRLMRERFPSGELSAAGVNQLMEQSERFLIWSVQSRELGGK
jgi:hypothetical protein